MSGVWRIAHKIFAQEHNYAFLTSGNLHEETLGVFMYNTYMREDDLVEWVNEQDEAISVVTRGRAHREGLLHRVIAILLQNEKGEILLQRRKNSLLDISVAGHVDVGEKYLIAAHRELKEELGVEDVELIDLGKYIVPTIHYQYFHTAHIYHLYLCKNFAQSVFPSPSEILGVEWFGIDHVLRGMLEDIEHKKYSRSFTHSLPVFGERVEQLKKII
jgi:8-oxo-dGTP pyrophosphatase MutT (NUDIX family)